MTSPNGHIEWRDFIEMQNQHRDLVSQNYRNHDKNIKIMHGKYLEHQIKEREKLKLNQVYDQSHQDDWDTTAYDGFKQQGMMLTT